MARRSLDLLLALALLSLAAPAAAPAQQPARDDDSASTAADSAGARRRGPPGTQALVNALSLRPLGPAVTSGRIVDIAIPEDEAGRRLGRLGKVMYVASATGGLWKTVNGGTTWEPVFQNESTISLGDVAVAPSNPNLVWVGTGEANNMRSSSWGDGVYRSENGGKTWTHMGLRTSQHIGRVLVHPTDPQTVFVAAVGPLWADGGERGLFRTQDGGKTWKNVLEISTHTGVTDVAMDPSNPDVMYAASLQRQRKAYSYIGGGPESGIWKSIDGGTTWTRLTEGLPKADMGRIGLSVSRSQPRTVYAVIEARGNAGGVYRSDDYGASWRQTSRTTSIPWYFGQIRVDPNDPERVYHLGVTLQLSEDGGRTFRNISGGIHADNHAMWIDPTDSKHLVVGNDGGLYLSYDGGEAWDFVPNLPVAQFYAVGVDMREPYYYVYGGLQDNNSWGAPSQTRTRAGVTNSDWFRVTGGDGFYAAVDPKNPNIVYAESQNGSIVRFDVATGERKTIKPVPKPGEPEYRWNWSSPILISPHDPATIYFGANYLFRSPDRGDSWTRLGGDLTRHLDRDTLPIMGRRTWPASTVARHEGVAEYGNISVIDESPRVPGLLWVGTDDGLVQLSRDTGRTWTTFDRFPGVPALTYVSRVVASPSADGTAYVAFDGHRDNDFRPYLFRTTDFGRTWTSIVGNLPASGPVYAIREHPRNPSLLFAGTEFGLFVSIDAGRSWARFTHDFPTTPVHDLVIHPRDDELVVATHGRGIFILDDLTPLLGLAAAREAATPTLFAVKPATLYNPSDAAVGGPRGAGALADRTFAAPNPEFGAGITYYLPSAVPQGAQLSLTILDSAGARVRELPVQRQAGLHRTTWNLRLNAPYTAPPRAGGNGGGGGFRREPQGPYVLPGRYVAELRVTRGRGAEPVVQRVPVEVRPDPLVTLTAAEYRQLHLARVEASQAQATVQAVVRSAEQLESQLDEVRTALRQATASDSLRGQVERVSRELGEVLRAVRGGGRGNGEAGGSGDDDEEEDVNRPSIQQRVNSVAQQIGNVSSLPTQIQRETLADGMSELRQQVERLNRLMATSIPTLNQALDAADVPWTIGRPIPWLGTEGARTP